MGANESRGTVKWSDGKDGAGGEGGSEFRGKVGVEGVQTFMKSPWEMASTCVAGC